MGVNKRSVKTGFGNAASTYDEAAVIQRESLQQLLARLQQISPCAENILDLGSGTGAARPGLRALYEKADYIGLDIAFSMLRHSAGKESIKSKKSVCADAEALPFKYDVFDIVFSASTLQWCDDISTVFAECLRILKPNGLLIFSTYGPQTLTELRTSFVELNEYSRVKQFLDMHIVGDLLVAAGFQSPVIESERICVEYGDPAQLLRDLKLTGATNHMQSRPKGLFTQKQIRSVLEAYQKFRLPNGKYPATYELIYGHGWAVPTDEITKTTDSAQWRPIKFKR